MKPKVDHQQVTTSSRMRAVAAAVGASAFVAMGALTLTLSGDDRSGTIVSEPGTFTAPVTSEMTTGETTKSSTVSGEVTETTSSNESASPAVTAEPAPTAEPG